MSRPAETRAERISQGEEINEETIQQLREKLSNVEREKARLEQKIAVLGRGDNENHLRSFSGETTRNADDRGTATAEESDVSSTHSLSENNAPIAQASDDDFEFVILPSGQDILIEPSFRSYRPGLTNDTQTRETQTDVLMTPLQQEERIRALERELDAARRISGTETQQQANIIKQLETKIVQSDSMMKAETQLRRKRVGELTQMVEAKDHEIESLKQRLQERENQLSEVRTRNAAEEEILAMYPAMQQQLIEYEESFNLEHRDARKLLKDKELFERHARIYERERDQAMQRARDAENKLSELTGSRRSSPIHQSIPASRQSDRDVSTYVWPRNTEYDFPPYTRSANNPPIQRIITPVNDTARGINQSATSQTGQSRTRASDPLSTSATVLGSERHDVTASRGATGGVGVAGARARVNENLADLDIPPWFQTSETELMKQHTKKHGMWTCLACGNENTVTRSSCAHCKTLGPPTSST
jgi:hypothetical protein